MNFNVGDQFVEFYDGDPEGAAYTVTKVDGDMMYADDEFGVRLPFHRLSRVDHLVAPCADCEGVCLTFYANEKVYKCEECGNEWD